MKSDTKNGTVSKILQGGHVFITRDGHTFGDRSATVFCHVKALGRSGIATDELRAGTRLSFRTKPPRCDRDRDEAFDLVSLAA